MGRGLTLAAAATLRGAFSAYLGVSGGPPCALHHLSMPHAATSSPRPALLPAASSRSLSAPSERHDTHTHTHTESAVLIAKGTCSSKDRYTDRGGGFTVARGRRREEVVGEEAVDVVVQVVLGVE